MEYPEWVRFVTVNDNGDCHVWSAKPEYSGTLYAWVMRSGQPHQRQFWERRDPPADPRHAITEISKHASNNA